MKKITFLITLIGVSIFAQEQFPGENENNLIINAGFEDNPSWGDEFSIGWRGYNCNRIEDKGVLFSNEWYNISVPSASGDGFAFTWAVDASIYQVFEVLPNTQYTVKYKFGWLFHPLKDFRNNGNAVITNNLTGDNKIVYKKFAHSENGQTTYTSYELLENKPGGGGYGPNGLYPSFTNWHDIEWTFTTGDNVGEVRLAMWTPSTLPSYILDNVEVFPTPAASINKFKDANFSLSPNPAKDVLNLRASKNISGIEIYNVMGQKVLAKSINAVNKSVDISILNKGMYLINVTIDSATESYRFIKE